MFLLLGITIVNDNRRDFVTECVDEIMLLIKDEPARPGASMARSTREIVEAEVEGLVLRVMRDPGIDFWQQAVTRWANKQFPDRTVHGTICKLCLEEIPEFLLNRQEPLEYADLVILILDIAGQLKLSVADALREKMEINHQRTWIQDPESGFYKHEK